MVISTEEERDLYNADCYRQLVARQRAGEGRPGRSNNCDICGFEPYTKNKYREKQDHLTKQHFKERIDALLPLTSPYRYTRISIQSYVTWRHVFNILCIANVCRLYPMSSF